VQTTAGHNSGPTHLADNAEVSQIKRGERACRAYKGVGELPIMQFPLGFKLPDSVTEDYGQFFLRAMMSKDDQTGAVTVPKEVSQDETFYMTRRDYGLMVNGIDRLGHH
jgi:hypothetical protein